MAPGPGDSADPSARIEALRLKTQALRQRSEEVRARARATREQILRGRSQRQILHDSEFARLAAKHQTMPVIEQAKGIIMVQQGCGPEEAFDLLRLASQRTNVKVHVLAARIVEQIAFGGNASNVTHISLGATTYRQSRTRPGRGPVSPPSAGELLADLERPY